MPQVMFPGVPKRCLAVTVQICKGAECMKRRRQRHSVVEGKTSPCSCSHVTMSAQKKPATPAYTDNGGNRRGSLHEHWLQHYRPRDSAGLLAHAALAILLAAISQELCHECKSLISKEEFLSTCTSKRFFVRTCVMHVPCTECVRQNRTFGKTGSDWPWWEGAGGFFRDASR